MDDKVKNIPDKELMLLLLQHDLLDLSATQRYNYRKKLVNFFKKENITEIKNQKQLELITPAVSTIEQETGTTRVFIFINELKFSQNVSNTEFICALLLMSLVVYIIASVITAQHLFIRNIDFS